MTSRHHHNYDGLFSTRVQSRTKFRYNYLLILCCVTAILLLGCWPEKSLNHQPDTPTSDNRPEHSLCPKNNAQDDSNTITAEVVALEQIITFNRFGAFNPAGMVYALRKDVVDNRCSLADEDNDSKNCHLDKLDDDEIQQLAGNVRLRKDKRPRPLVLRVNECNYLKVTFWNLLSPLPTVHTKFQRTDFPEGGVQKHSVLVTEPGDPTATDLSTPPRLKPQPKHPLSPFPPQEEPDYPTTRAASIHVNGLDYANIESDGANVGKNPSSLAEPGASKTYTWYARQEGGYFFYSAGALAGGEGDGGQLGLGLFGSVNVEPQNSVWYRSQVTHGDLTKAKTSASTHYDDLDYKKLAILDADNQIVHSDLNAIIYQTDKTNETPEICAQRSPGSSCGMSFREFTTIFHDENKVFQAFAELSDEGNPISAIADGMAINYGSSGAGSVVLANRKKLGPGKDCPECKLEEFFLSSWVNGDPAMIVQRNMDGKPVKALYPDDPSNVHHSYLGDPVRFRNIHAGPKETHVFHLHAHQWLQDKNDPNANYLDSQTISPGSSYTYDIQYGGGGNRNLTVGDAIFHCHLYPHFAAGMWELWRNHDVFEDGKPGFFNKDEPVSATNDPRMRNLPDYELADKGGSPNPAIVPIPGYPLAPLSTKEMRGYPFFMDAVPGHRPPQPPLDMARDDKDTDKELNGGLPRHVITGGSTKPQADPEMRPEELLKGQGDPKATKASRYVAERTWKLNSDPNNLVLAQKLDKVQANIVPQCGSKDEILAMAYHAGWNRNDLLNLKKGINTVIDKDGNAVKDKSGNTVPLMPKWCTKEVQQTLADLDENFAWQQSIPNVSWPNKIYDGHKMNPLWTGKGYDNKVANKPDEGNPNDKTYDPGKYFRVNGYKPRPGAPFAEPCPATYYEKEIDEKGKESFIERNVNADDPRLYKSAYIQFDLTVNKYGWHDPQARMPVLEEDALATIDGKRLAEPLFFRANSGDCIQFQATNLIPGVLNLDDFQVYTPTDTIGQHIHLVKFDVTSSDGSANGWNYEDGTFAPDEVRERIDAIRKYGGWENTKIKPEAEIHPALQSGGSLQAKASLVGQCPNKDPKNEGPWCGAQTTVQRWWADPVLNDKWDDRTMRAVFTHDHYGPSSHQQHGFYAALIVEPKDTVWTQLGGNPESVVAKNNNGVNTLKCALPNSPDKAVTAIGNRAFGGGHEGKPFKCREDGGPTSFAANIVLPKDHAHTNNEKHRHEIGHEYNLAFADFAILYNTDLRPVNPPSRQADLMLPHVVRDGLKPKPEGISTEDPGTRLLNYRNEPIPLRIAEEDKDSLEYHQKTTLGNGKGKVRPEGDMANVFSSLIDHNPKPYTVTERIGKLKKLVPHEIIDTDRLTSLIGQQLKNTQNFKKLLHENEPWRVDGDGDPSTPVLIGYAGEKANIQLIQGSQEEQHVFSMNGVKWLAEPRSVNSGYMNGQQIGISEHFEMEAKLPNDPGITDYWFGSPSVENFWDGMWGLFRACGGSVWNKTSKSICESMAPKSNAVEVIAKQIGKNLASLAKLEKGQVKLLPDLWDVSKEGLEVDEYSKDFLEEFHKQRGKYLKGKKSDWRSMNNVKGNKLEDKDIKGAYSDYYDKHIWKKNVCPFKEYSDSNANIKHVVALLAKDVVPAKDSDFYNLKFNIADPQGIVFVELDKEWVRGQQEQIQKSIINLKNLPGATDLPGIQEGLNAIPAEDIITKLRTAYQNGKKIEPLVLRAKAGECIRVTLHNLLPENFLDGPSEDSSTFNSWSYNLMPPIVSGFNFNQVRMSSTINLIPQMVAHDAKKMGGGNIGLNLKNDFTDGENTNDFPTKGLPGCRKLTPEGKPNFSACNNTADYIWYAGNRQVVDMQTYDIFNANKRLEIECPVQAKMHNNQGYVCHTPIEFGVVSLRSFGDVIKQSSHGAVGALVIEPKDSTVTFPDPSTRITADISWKDKDGKNNSFREFVAIFQDDLSLHQNGQPMPNHRMADDAEDTGQKGFNYRTEPLWARNGVGTSGADFNTLNNVDYSNTLSSILPNPGCGTKPNSVCGDPETPVFHAKAGENIRLRLVHPNGHSRQHAFALYGHNWDYQPWMNESTEIAVPEQKEIHTALVGAIGGIGPGRHFNIVTKAGGANAVPGDYLFRVQENFQFHAGMLGILRVE